MPKGLFTVMMTVTVVLFWFCVAAFFTAPFIRTLKLNGGVGNTQLRQLFPCFRLCAVVILLGNYMQRCVAIFTVHSPKVQVMHLLNALYFQKRKSYVLCGYPAWGFFQKDLRCVF